MMYCLYSPKGLYRLMSVTGAIMDIESDLKELDNLYITLESLRIELANTYTVQTQTLSNEGYNESWDRIDLFEVSLENTAHRTGIHTASDVAWTGLKEKYGEGKQQSLSKVGELLEDGSKKIAGKLDDGIKHVAKKAPGALLKSARVVLDKISTLLGRIGAITSKILATGYPLMGTFIKRAQELKEKAKRGEITPEEHFNLKKANQYLFIKPDEIASPKMIIDNLKYIKGIQENLLSQSKLNEFDQLCDQIFSTYQISTKKGKSDQLVFAIAVLGLLTNPGVSIGAVFKKILEKASPNIGQTIDHAATLTGGVYQGISILLLSMGKTGAVYTKQIGMGKLSIASIPKFSPLYPFCDVVQRGSPHLIYDEKTSHTLLGRYQFRVRDYKDTIDTQMSGSFSRVGVSFEQPDKSVPKDNNVKALSKDEIIRICDIIIDMMTNAQAYCRRWDQFYKSYEKQFEKITHIVMTYGSGDEESSVVTDYIRYSYRNAINLVLGSLWNNCFGTDNQFIRYHLKLCHCLLDYCQHSTKDQAEDDQ